MLKSISLIILLRTALAVLSRVKTLVDRLSDDVPISQDHEEVAKEIGLIVSDILIAITSR